MTSSTKTLELAAVYDAATNRELLLAPQPLDVLIATSPKVTVLRVENTDGGDLRLTISSDQPWLRTDRTVLDLPASGTAEIRVTVDPAGAGEFAILQLSWQTADGDLADHVLVRRQRAASTGTKQTSQSDKKMQERENVPPPSPPPNDTPIWVLEQMNGR